MKQQSQNEIYSKIRSILKKIFSIQNIKLKTFNIRTFLWMSSIYALFWIIITYNPKDFGRLARYHVLEYLKESIITTFEYMFWVYLPEMVILIFDFIVKRCELNNKDVVKAIRILIMILSYIYLVVFGILIYVVIMGARGLFVD